jgi:hypothetical protein
VEAPATAITQADVDRLRRLGLTDGDILDVILAATARCFFSKTLDAAGVQADARFATLEPELRDARTRAPRRPHGRPPDRNGGAILKTAPPNRVS